MIYQPKNRDEWLSLRKTVITSTEVGALFGMDWSDEENDVSPYFTALELALLKTGKIDDNFKLSDRTKWGTRLQDSIAAGVAEDFGVDVRPMNEFITIDELRMGSSFDWQIVGINNAKCDDQALRIAFGERGPGILEIKNVDGWIYKKKWLDGEPPAHIELQLQHQLECSSLGWGVVAPLIGGNSTRIVLRERYTDVGMAIRAKVAKFWADLDQGIYPPPDMPEDADTIRRLYNYAEPGKLLDARDNEEIRTLCAEYIAAGDAIKKATDQKDVARARLLERIGDAEKVLANGYSISAGMIGPAPISYTRAGYRDFRVFKKKEAKKS